MNDKQDTKKKKRFKGTVVSDAMDKTIVVAVDRFVKHPRYLKYIKKSKKYHVHDSEDQYRAGDVVMIEEIQPVSKRKRFQVIGRADNNKA